MNSETRSMTSSLKSNKDNEDIFIEGYFVVFNRETKLFDGAFEEISKEAFNNTLKNDIRALINHDTKAVLGRTKAKTLELKVDEKGLWGKIKINKKDTEAVNLYERVKRGDVDQCSFGFNVIKEDIEHKENGEVKWILKEVDLHEISVCTFPAYKETEVSARQLSNEEVKKRQLFIKKYKLKEKLKKCLSK